MIGAMLLIASWSVEVWVKIPPTPEVLAAPRDPDEVVVNGERIRRLEIKVSRDRKTKAVGCRLKRPSGDPKLDAAICAEAVACDEASAKRATLQTCLMPRVEAAIRARYPGRDIGKPAPFDGKH